MKHPLTSKERRGLTAVAAAALLCIGGAFAFRSCQAGSGRSGDRRPIEVVDNDSTMHKDTAMRTGNRTPVEKSTDGKRARRAKRATKKQTSEKTYPTRQPLDEPCD